MIRRSRLKPIVAVPIQIRCIAKRPDKWVKEASAEYLRRLSGRFKIEVKTFTPAATRQAHQVRLGEEARRLRRACPPRARCVALTSDGEMWTSQQFADKLERWSQDHHDTVFFIGGADGLAAELLDAVHERLSLSRFTMPHQLARLVLIEQIYRASMIIGKHPYHRA